MSLRRSSRAAATKPAIVDASGSDSGDDYEEEDAGYEEEEQDVEEELLEEREWSELWEELEGEGWKREDGRRVATHRTMQWVILFVSTRQPCGR